MIRPKLRLAALAVAAALAALPASAQETSGQDRVRGTDLPLPRFVSLKSDKVNVRRGPGEEYEVAFTFLKSGLPVEITQEFDTWRKIRDSDGEEGWVYHSLLSGKRTALVSPWQQTGLFPARASAETDGQVVAYLEPRVIVDVESCSGTWCKVAVGGYEGWIEQSRLWGVYPNEKVDE